MLYEVITVFIDSDKLGVIEKLEEIKEELSFDEELYERFRSLRKELASNHEVPAYVCSSCISGENQKPL